MKLSKRAGMMKKSMESDQFSISKYANIIYSPPELVHGATIVLQEILMKMCEFVQQNSFDLLKEHFNMKPVPHDFVVDFKDFPKQYEKFDFGEPYIFNLMFNLGAKELAGHFSPNLKAIVLGLPDFTKLFQAYSPNQVAGYLTNIFFPLLRHEIVHATQLAMYSSWVKIHENFVPKQFSPLNYIMGKENSSPEEISKYITQPLEFEPWIIYSVNEFLKSHNYKISMQDLKDFISNSIFFQELNKKDSKLHNLAVKKFYKIIFDKMTPEDRQQLMKESS